MKDFEKTKGMVERWNFLVTCLNNPKASEEETRETIDEMFHLSARFPFETRRELIAIADMKDMQIWFDVWVRILLKLERMRDFLHYDLPQAWVQESKLHEYKLFQELGKTMKETACDYHLSMPTLPEHFLSPWDIIEATQTTNNDNVGNNATRDEKARFRAKYDEHIKDMESFFDEISTMKGRELSCFYKKFLSRSNITLKEFVNDVLDITPERENEKGWNYEAIRKY